MFRALICPSSGARDYDVDYHIGRFVLGLLYVGDTGYNGNNSYFWRRHCSGCGGDTVMGVISLVSCGRAIFR